MKSPKLVSSKSFKIDWHDFSRISYGFAKIRCVIYCMITIWNEYAL